MVQRTNLAITDTYNYYHSFPKYLNSYLIGECKNLLINIAFYMSVNFVLQLANPQVWLYSV